MSAIDFSLNFDTITNWTFNYDDHRMGIVQTKVQELCTKVNTKLTNISGLAPITDADQANPRKMMLWLMSHKPYFSITDFVNTLNPDETCYSSFMFAIHTPVVSEALTSQVQELQKQLETFKHEANQISVLQQQLKKVQLRESQQTVVQARGYNPNNLSLPNNSSNFHSNISETSFEFRSANTSPVPMSPLPNPSVTVTAPSPTAPPLVTGATAPPVTRVNLTSSTDQKLAELTNICAVMMNNVGFGKKQKVGSSRPDIYVPKEHGSLTSYALNEFVQWADSQLLSEADSTMFFAYAFKKPIHRNHIMYLAKGVNGQPRHTSLMALVQETIKHLKLNDESIDDLQTKYCNFNICKRVPLDEEFLRLFETRKLGFPGESHAICVGFCKQKFIHKLDGNNTLHSKLEIRQFHDIWINATSYFEVVIQLRDIESKYRGTTSSSFAPNNSPTKMECNVISCHPCHVNNIETSQTSNSHSQNNNNANQFNNIATKTCKNPSCNKQFTPSRPKYLCCDMDCFKAWKGPSAEKSFRKRSPKSHNNMQATQSAPQQAQPTSTPAPAQPAAPVHKMNNITELNDYVNSNNNVSNDMTYNTPAHLFVPNCKIPFVVHNSLYDTGASVTLMTADCMKKANLQSKLVKNQNKGILGGDQKPLVGYRGYIPISISIEDSTGNITDSFTKNILVFDKLNHDFIVGRDVMNTFRQVSEFPMLNKILINPTNRMVKKFSKIVADKLRSINNVQTFDKYGDDSTFYLQVPNTTFNNVAFDRYQFLAQGFCDEFMSSVEKAETKSSVAPGVNNVTMESDSPLADVLTEGGLDGTLDTRNITVSQTKLIQTSKGAVSVGSAISSEMEAKLKNFIDNHKGEVFNNKTLGKTKQVCHPVLKPDAQDFTATPKYMPLNTFMKTEANKLVSKMVDLGVLVESTETANSTIFIVQKTSGKWRLICDLRKYNQRLADFIVHLPSPYELINKICQFELFSYVDFPDAYFNVPLSEDSIKNNPIVASVSGQPKNFKFLRMAQGLAPATAEFVNIINEVYAPINDFVVNYLDDSVIGSDADEELHFTRLKRFIKLTEEAGLKLSLAKSVFFAADLTFLNYTVANKAWALSENQRATINALNTDNLTPKKRESLAAFIQHFNKFHTSVAFASRVIRDPTTSAETVKSILDNIKRKLIKSPALRSVNFQDDLHIFTDASQFDCSGIIVQKCKSGSELVACFSRKFPLSVANKCIYEKELWTLHQVSKTFRYLFLGPHRKVFHQDNNAVLAAQKSKAPSLNCLFNTLKSTFSNVKFVFTPTSQNASDCFTRLKDKAKVNAILDLPTSIFDNDDLLEIPDSELEEVVSAPQNQVESSTSLDSSVPVVTPEPVFNSKMPQAIVDKILKIHCNAGCASADRILITLQGLEENSDLVKNDILDVIKNCPVCKDIRNHSRPRKSSPGITIPKETTTQECIFIDHKKIISKSRARAIQKINLDDPNFTADGIDICLTVFEPVSKHVSFYPVEDYSSENVKNALRIHFVNNAPSLNVIADNAPCFSTLKNWLKTEFNSSLHHTSAYHPNSNLSERAHKEFEKVVRLYDAKTGQYNFENWRDTLARACVSMNTLRHSLHKMSAYEIFKNRIQSNFEPVQFHPVGLEHRVKNEKFSEKVEKVYKSKLKIKLPIFSKGSQVKVDIPGQPIRFGIVTSTADHEFKMSIRIKFGSQRPVAISKNFVCLPRNGATPDSGNIDITTNRDGFDTITNPVTEGVAATENSQPSEPFPFASVPIIEESARDARTRRRQNRKD